MHNSVFVLFFTLLIFFLIVYKNIKWIGHANEATFNSVYLKENGRKQQPNSSNSNDFQIIFIVCGLSMPTRHVQWRFPVLWTLYVSKWCVTQFCFSFYPHWSCWQYNWRATSCGLQWNTNWNNKYYSCWVLDGVRDDTARDSALLPTQEEEEGISSVKILSLQCCQWEWRIYDIQVMTSS